MAEGAVVLGVVEGGVRAGWREEGGDVGDPAGVGVAGGDENELLIGARVKYGGGCCGHFCSEVVWCNVVGWLGLFYSVLLLGSQCCGSGVDD